MKIVTLGIDLGKNLCSLAGLDGTGAVVPPLRLRCAKAPSTCSGLSNPCLLHQSSASNGVGPSAMYRGKINPISLFNVAAFVGLINGRIKMRR